MAKRKSMPRSREAIQFRTGEPLLYGSNLGLPRPQERVPRSLPQPLSRSRKPRLLRSFSAKPLLRLQVRRQALSMPPRSRRSGGKSKVMSRFYNPMHVLRMANPKRVTFCLKRRIRREVLFAFRNAGYRGSGPGRRGSYRRNGNSLYGC